MSFLPLAAFATAMLMSYNMAFDDMANEILDFPMSVKPPFLISTRDCLEFCNNRGGFCGGFCGTEGYCCRKGYGDCMQIYENVATESHHSCVKGFALGQSGKEEEEGPDTCRVDLLSGEHNIAQNIILGELDQLSGEYNFTFDIKPLINSSRVTEYQLTAFNPEKPYIGGKFVISGKHGRYNTAFCGCVSGNYGKCTRFSTSHKTGEWIHVRIRQHKNELGIYLMDVAINGIPQEQAINTIPQVVIERLHVVVIVLPSTPNAVVLRDIRVGSCNSKFNQTLSTY